MFPDRFARIFVPGGWKGFRRQPLQLFFGNFAGVRINDDQRFSQFAGVSHHVARAAEAGRLVFHPRQRP